LVDGSLEDAGELTTEHLIELPRSTVRKVAPLRRSERLTRAVCEGLSPVRWRLR